MPRVSIARPWSTLLLGWVPEGKRPPWARIGGCSPDLAVAQLGGAGLEPVHFDEQRLEGPHMCYETSKGEVGAALDGGLDSE